jgi:hypothetical protein
VSDLLSGATPDLQAFLQRVVNGGGRIVCEFAAGDKPVVIVGC